MKKTKFLAMFMAIAMILSICPVNVFAADAQSTLYVEATDVAHPDEEVVFTVYATAKTAWLGWQCELDIPEGLTYVAGSGAMDTDFVALVVVATGDIAVFDENSKTIQVMVGGDPFTVDGKIKMMTFKCKVDAAADLKEYTVSLKDLIGFDGEGNELMEPDCVAASANLSVVCSHNYGSLVPEVPATHTATELKGGMEAHYYCDKCDTYFDADKKETTEEELRIPVPSHSYNETVWAKDGENHWHACECGAKSDVEGHKGGTATCKAYAVCSVCNEPYGAYAPHNYGDLIEEVKATHTPEQLLPGKKAHYQCSVCEKFFDKDKQEVKESDLTIPTPSHSFGNTWTSGNSQHWHACECGAKKDVANCEDKKEPKDNKCDTCGAIMCVHASIVLVEKDGEDCDTDGVLAHYKCEACGAKFSDANGENSVTDEDLKIPAHHTLGDWNLEDPAQCEQAGTKGYYYCSACEKNFEADGKTEITDLTIPALEHDCTLEGGSKATCMAVAKCGRCGKDYGEKDANNHVGGNQISYNETQHWGICACNEPLTPENHKGGTATCVAKAECEVCHQLYGEVDANAHLWKEVERLEATKQAEGWIKYECERNSEHTKTEPIAKLPSAVITPVGPSKDKEEEPGEVELTMSFADITAADWFYDTIKYTYENGLMNGVSEDNFAPYANTSRSMLVTILWRLEGKPAPLGNCQFVDVPAGAWYAEAVTWAAEKGIVTGLTATEFGPDANITREQFATILYRYAKNYKGYDVSVGEDTNILSYTDAMIVSEYAIPAMQWACGAGLINGIDGALQPAGFANRAQAATILARFCQNYQ